MNVSASRMFLTSVNTRLQISIVTSHMQNKHNTTIIYNNSIYTNKNTPRKIHSKSLLRNRKYTHAIDKELLATPTLVLHDHPGRSAPAVPGLDNPPLLYSHSPNTKCLASKHAGLTSSLRRRQKAA